MAIRQYNGAPECMIQAMRVLGIVLPDLKIAELGNQKISAPPSNPHKSVLEFYGAQVVSFDRNGRDGAEQVDLSMPIPVGKWREHFDLVTNFGTSEHVSAGQMQVFHTVHDLCRVGGVMIHVVPQSGTCKNHGSWKYTVEWFQWLADFCGYDVIRCDDWKKEVGKRDSRWHNDRFVSAIFQKQKQSTFIETNWVEPPTK